MLSHKELRIAADNFFTTHPDAWCLSPSEMAHVVADELAVFESAAATDTWRYVDDEYETPDSAPDGCQRSAAQSTLYTYIKESIEPYLAKHFSKLARQMVLVSK